MAVSSTAPNASRTAVYLLGPGQTTPRGPALAELRHLSGTLVKAAVVPGSSTLVVSAVPSRAADLSFAAVLLLVQAGRPSERLVGSLQHGVRPVPTRERAYVVRGGAGAEPTGRATARGGLRRDLLTVDAVDLQSKQVRTLYRHAGYLLMPIGILGRELIVHQVGPGESPPGEDRAELVAIDVESAAVRRLVAVSALSRDFSLDEKAGAVLFTGHDPATQPGGGGAWVVYRYSVGSAAPRLEALARGATPALFPHAWPDGRVAFARPGGGLALVGGSVVAPLVTGLVVVRSLVCHRGQWWSIGLVKGGSAFSRLFFLNTVAGDEQSVQFANLPRGTIEVAGTVTGAKPAAAAPKAGE